MEIITQQKCIFQFYLMQKPLSSPFNWILTKMSLILVFHILTQFSSAVTYSMFVTLGLITSVPVSAGKFDATIETKKKHIFN